MSAPGEERVQALVRQWTEFTPENEEQRLIKEVVMAFIERLREVEGERDRLHAAFYGPPAEMSSSLGLVPINSNGMRRVVDALAQAEQARDEAERRIATRIPKVCPICTVTEMVCEVCHNPRAEQAEQRVAGASGVMADLLEHTRVAPENGRRLIMEGHGKSYDHLFEKLRLLLTPPPPAPRAQG